MKNYTALRGLISLSLLFGSLSGYSSDKPVRFTVRHDQKHQVIDNFGASDAWRIAFVGRYWPVEKREKIADLLFSRELDAHGNPEGIGLSNWRVNIGAGSHENRENREVTSDWNRTECFMSPDGTYDFTKQAGQQWFMNAARERGVDDFLFFTNSAPYFMTRSGATLATDAKAINLRLDQFDDFADFLARTASHFIEQGYNVRYISPINEPQIDWGQNKWQEGSFATNADAYRLIGELDRAISRYDLPTQVVFGEAADMKFLFDCDSNALTPDNLISDFVSDTARYDIMQMENVYNCISAHDYWSAYPSKVLVDVRERVASHLKNESPDTKFWASEYCILEKNEDISGEPSPLKSINLGLYVARIIHADLAIANASAWQWWTAISMGEDVPIQLKPCETATGGSLKYDGEIAPTKMLWTTGNYSLFIRPGMWRVSLDRSDDLSDMDSATALMGSAYTDGDRTVCVFINYSNDSQSVQISNEKDQRAKVYVTSIDKNLEYQGEKSLSKLIISPRSVVTVVCD